MLDDTATAAGAGKVPAARRAPGNLNRERVLDIRHYTDKLFSFRTTRSPAFRFDSGQFVMIGLEVEGRPLMRAYSMASAPYDEHLEFFSIKVPDGPLTSRLQHIRPGDEVLVGAKPTGTLLLGNLRPGRRLYLLATGTGFAPFASILRDPGTYEHFETVIAVEGCRDAAELAFATDTIETVRAHEYLGEAATEKLRYYATTTREASHHRGRITDLIRSGHLMAEFGLPSLDPVDDRVMICGNPGMLAETKDLLSGAGFAEGSNASPADFVIERAFVER
jgi:ferredoxin--NADP+ reductase